MSGVADLLPRVTELIDRKAVKVPPYPAAAMRLRDLVAGEVFGANELVTVIAEDQVLAATLLRYANSAMYRGADAVTSLQDAIGRIGSREVCRIALGISLAAPAIGSGPLGDLRGKVWRQSLTAAIVAAQLAPGRGVKSDEAFVCGLLGDFGRVVAIACLEEILAREQDGRVLPEASWSQAIDRFQVELGLLLASRWNLPEVVRAVIATHRDPAQAAPQHRAMVEIVATADAVVALLERGRAVTAEALAAVVPDRAAAADLLEIIPDIPRLLAALDEVAAAGDLPGVPSQIDGTRTSGVRPAAIPVKVLRAEGALEFVATHVSPTSLGLRGRTRLRVGSVVRVRLEGAAPPLELTLAVTLSMRDADGAFVEGKLFAPDFASQAEWDRFYGSL